MLFWHSLVDVVAHTRQSEDTTDAGWTLAYVNGRVLGADRAVFNRLFYREVTAASWHPNPITRLR